MKFRSEYIVASAVIVGALVILGALSVVIGNFDFGVPVRSVKIYFESIGGVQRNTEVRVAGAQVGRVQSIKVLPRDQQVAAPNGKKYMVVLTCSVDPSVELSEDATATLRSDSLLSPKVVVLIPGDSKELLTANSYVKGFTTPDVTDLAGPVMSLVDEVKPAMAQIGPMMNDARQLFADAKPVMADARAAVVELKPAISSMGKLASNLETSLPDMVQRMDKVLDQTNDLLADLNSRQVRGQLQSLMVNARVLTENLKVVSSNAKALTWTLAERPWRLLWGGKVTPPPPEMEVLDSNKVIPLTVPGGKPSPSNNSGSDFRERKSR